MTFSATNIAVKLVKSQYFLSLLQVTVLTHKLNGKKPNEPEEIIKMTLKFPLAVCFKLHYCRIFSIYLETTPRISDPFPYFPILENNLGEFSIVMSKIPPPIIRSGFTINMERNMH